MRESRYHSHHGHHGGGSGRHHHLSPHVRFSNIEGAAGGRLPQVELLGADGNAVMVSAPAAAAAAAAASAAANAEGGGGGSRRRCHHMIAEEGASGGGGGTGSPHVVQRTQSNPEMECCPVCLARKECEILLKRTYSKVPFCQCTNRRKRADNFFFAKARV